MPTISDLMTMTEELVATVARQAIGTDQIDVRRTIRSRWPRRLPGCRCARRPGRRRRDG